jgi:heme oxygenase (biliverdin-IX-beta and delta-forming)
MNELATFTPTSGLALRWRLRTATARTHERMHAHAGFEAAAAGTISVLDYRRLLIRLYGFHRPFEDVARSAVDVFEVDLDMGARARSPLLLADLQTLGAEPSAEVSIPLWRPSIRLGSRGSLLGALYVLEGSALGGLQIARALNERAGRDVGKAHLFFAGHRQRQSGMWRELLRELEALRHHGDEEAQAEASAVATFDAFENWMAGWR